METATWTRRAAQVIWDVLTPQDDPIKMPQLLTMRAYNSAVRHGAHVAAARRRQHPNLFELPIGEGIQPGRELDLVARCQSIYRITMLVENPQDNSFLRRSLQLAVELATAYGGIIRDVQAVRLFDASGGVAMLKAPSVGWAHTQLYSREVSNRDVSRRKIYSRGMVKFGLPDLQLGDVPDPCRKRARAIMRHLIDKLCDFRFQTLPLNMHVENYPVTFVKIANGDDGFFPYERMELRDYVEPINLIGQTAARVLQFHAPGQTMSVDEDDDFVAPLPPPEEVVAANDSPEEPGGPRFRIEVSRKSERPAPPPVPGASAPPIPPPLPGVSPRATATLGSERLDPGPAAPLPQASAPQVKSHAARVDGTTSAGPYGDTLFDDQPRRAALAADPSENPYSQFADTFSLGNVFEADELAPTESAGLELSDSDFSGIGGHAFSARGHELSGSDFTGIGDPAPAPARRLPNEPQPPRAVASRGGDGLGLDDEAPVGFDADDDSPDRFVPMIHFFGASRSTIWVFASGAAPTLPALMQELMRTKFILEPTLITAAPTLDVAFRHPTEGFRISLKVHAFPAGRPLELASLAKDDEQRQILESVSVRALTTVEGALTSTATTHQVKLVQALQRASRGVIYDESSQHIWDPPQRFNFALVDAVTPLQLAHIHVEPREKRHDQAVWVHSHGLERIGFPNIDILGLDRVWASRAKQLVEYLVGQLELAKEAERANLRSFDIEGERLRLIPKAEYVALLRGVELIGARSDANHQDERVVLVDPKAQNTPYPLVLTRVLDQLTRR